MNLAEYQAFSSHRNSLGYNGRKALKESEMLRLAYSNQDPLSVMLHLETLKLLWY